MLSVLFRGALIAMLLGAGAAAQRAEPSPQAIVVNPAPSYRVSVWLDRAPEALDIPRYEVGDPVRIGVRTDEDAYVYLFSVSANGDVVQILPNRFDGGRDAFQSAGTTRLFPPSGAAYTFTADAPGGLARVVALASRRPLDTGTLASFDSEHDLLATSQLGPEGFARALAIVVTPLPQESWVTATAEFYVGTAPGYELTPRQVEEFLNSHLRLAPYPGSVVTRPVPDFAIAAGSPARVLRYRAGAPARPPGAGTGVGVAWPAEGAAQADSSTSTGAGGSNT